MLTLAGLTIIAYEYICAIAHTREQLRGADVGRVGVIALAFATSSNPQALEIGCGWSFIISCLLLAALVPSAYWQL
jgi:hypothetical protein